MIYLFCGDNRIKAQAKLAEVTEAFKRRNPHGSVFRFDNDQFSAERIEELTAGASLFGEKRLMVCRELAANKAALDLMSEHLGEIAAAAAVLIWFEPEASPELVKKVKQSGGRVLEFALTKQPGFNLFELSDALAARDRGRAWLVLHRALRAGVSPEEIFWRGLVWRAKRMLGAGTSRKFSPPELRRLSARLVALWHDTKREEGRDFPLELERFLLTI